MAFAKPLGPQSLDGLVPQMSSTACGAFVRRRCMRQGNVRWEATVLTNLRAQLAVGGSETLPSGPLRGEQTLVRVTPGFSRTDSTSQYCTDALLTVEPSQVYLYKGCGDYPATDLLQATFSITSQRTSSTISRQVTSAISTIPPLSTPSTAAEESASSTTSVTSPASPSSVSLPEQQNNNGAIVGGVVGGVALIFFMVLAVLWIRKRKGGNAQVPAYSEQKPVWAHELPP
ncbi:hypothetical protein EPUS_08185 [Endocarpon pusillum Z07020]|uniref:Mid2 domain-containing protein n=1 Tax=Endocarpon pusillum (strain Z07020 / HMAS-L-300199) TaxID=1263415 RepID=U1GB77_ENDPU|nr:uncharacterized protein EPUS_08185 [Endocarpon pusillum Z07020]ERF68951.1 hypothetical protein EPUS_08185 [Endocarpon pusillum Z07020]